MSFNPFAKKKKEVKDSSDDDSFYGGSSDDGSEEKKESFYGGDDDSDKPKEQSVNKSAAKQKDIFGLKWWELLVIGVEFILLIYTALVFLGLAKLF